VNEQTLIAGTTKEEVLVIGSAGGKSDDAITLDIDPDLEPDVVHDLHKVPMPFEDNQFKYICCHHVFEHLDDLSPVMGELHRVCKPDGVIYIEVPHHSSWQASTAAHKLRFSYFALDGFFEGVDTWRRGKKFKVIKREMTFHRAFRRYFLHKLFNSRPLTYERFWTYVFPAEHLKIWIKPVK